MRTLFLIRNGHANLLCGSSFELPVKYVMGSPTDVDMLYIPTDICALPLNVSAPHTFQGKTLVINTKSTHPGFARLFSPDCMRLYCKQARIIDGHCANGPALTKIMMTDSKHTDFINSIWDHIGGSQYHLYKSLLEMRTDRVFAIYCPLWPTDADEWKTRERSSGWPPREVIHQVVDGGCDLVAKPHPSSPEDDTQWRFSFS